MSDLMNGPTSLGSTQIETSLLSRGSSGFLSDGLLGFRTPAGGPQGDPGSMNKAPAPMNRHQSATA